MRQPQAQSNDLLNCARYAFKPNQLAYCGPDRNKELAEYLEKSSVDQGLAEILKKFETLFPYLKLIASENKIGNPFDQKVVEAYWIGNDLLNNIRKIKLHEHLTDNLLLKRKLPYKEFIRFEEKLKDAERGGAHHSFHVFNIWKRTGFIENPHTLFTMDECRVGWGRVIDSNQNTIQVGYEPLIFLNGKLSFGEFTIKNIALDAEKRMPQKNDWVSFHWSSYCKTLSLDELQNLRKWTKINLNIYNMNQKIN